MPTLRIIPALSTLLLLVQFAPAQSADWQTVKDIPPGTRVSVTARHKFIHTICEVQGATDEELSCDIIVRRPHPFTPSTLRYPREKVRQVRLEHSDASNMASGAAIGAGIGATLGVAASGGQSGNTRLGGGILLGSIGAVIGGFMGRDLPLFHGHVIYQQAGSERKSEMKHKR